MCPCLRVPTNCNNCCSNSLERGTSLGAILVCSFFQPFPLTMTPSSRMSSMRSPGRVGSQDTQNPFRLSRFAPHFSHLSSLNQCHSQDPQKGTHTLPADPTTSPTLKSPIVSVFSNR